MCFGSRYVRVSEGFQGGKPAAVADMEEGVENMENSVRGREWRRRRRQGGRDAKVVARWLVYQ